MSVFRNLLMQSTGWLGKPSDWSDIRKDCHANSIALYAGHTADYSKYDNLGFTATCIGGYKVYIDGEHYGTYASASQCNIIWSQSGANGGDDITTPSALKAHKIWIIPAIEGNNITAFKCARVASSGREQQGVLWAHFNINNVINLEYSFAIYNGFYQPLMLALTAKNNIIKCNKLPQFGQASDLAGYAANIEYTPTFDLNNNTINGAPGFLNLLQTAELEKIVIKNGSITGSITSFSHNATKLKKIITKNVNIIPTGCDNAFRNNQSLEELPDIDYSNATRMGYYLTNAAALKDTVLDVSAAKGLTTIGCYGNSTYFMSGFKGLRVSNEAPFNNATSPQINVNYTGMDRSALVQLFEDLPYNVGYTVVGSPTITDGIASGFSGSDYLSLPLLPTGDDVLNFEINTKFTLPSESSSTQYQYIMGQRNTNLKAANIAIFLYKESSSTCSLWCRFVDFTDPDNLITRQKRITTQPNTIPFGGTYSINIKCFNGILTACLYNSSGTVIDLITDNKHILGFKRVQVEYLAIGQYAQSYSFNGGSIDLNETYIKVNDVYWFRGQPAMTKTLSCVGATGTADLTAEDKDIALNKGWEITIS